MFLTAQKNYKSKIWNDNNIYNFAFIESKKIKISNKLPNNN